MSPDPIDETPSPADASLVVGSGESNTIKSERQGGSIDGSLSDVAHAVLLDVLERSAQCGFLGPGPVENQLHHALHMGRVVSGLLEPGGQLLDLGSGGGVPGLVIACLVPTSRVTLMDSQERRCAFLRQAAERLHDELGIDCAVEQGRAELLGRRPDLDGAFQTVVARSFGSPAVVAECAARFIAANGYLVVAEPPNSDGARWDAGGLTTLGMELRSAVTTPLSCAITQRTGTLDDRFPRRDGVPRRKPLW